MDYTRFLRWALIIGLCFVPFIAFIVADGTHFPTNLFFPYITGKNFTFRILIEVLTAVYVILAVRVPKYRPRASKVMWTFGLFAAWMLLATIFSVDPVKSFWSNFERMDGYITLIHLFLMFVIAGAVLTAEDWWDRFFQVSVVASALQGVYALLQAFHLFGLSPSSQSGARADTTFGNATYLAVFMLFNFFITLYLLVRDRKSITSRTLYGIALLLQFLGLYFTQSRGPLLGMLGGLVIAGIYIAMYAKGTEWKNTRRYSLYGLGVIAVVVVLFLGLKNTSFIQKSNTLQRLASISLVDKTTQSRFLIWGEAWKGVTESPKTIAIGWGQENFNYVFNKYYNPKMYDQEQWFDRAHNEFIDWLVAGGIPAFLLYIGLFLAAAYSIIRSKLDVPEQAIFLGLLAAYAFNNLLVFDNLLSYAYFGLILAFAHGLAKSEVPGRLFMAKPLDDKVVAIIAPIVLVVAIFAIYELNAPGLSRGNMLINALTSVNMQTGAPKDPMENLNQFKLALADGPLGYQETVEQLFQFTSNSVASSQSVSPATKQAAYTLTRQSGDALLVQRKGDARLELFYGVFLDQFAQYPDALAHLESAMADSPKKQQILFELGATYLAKGDNLDALTPLKQAYEETPQYDDAILYYTTALYYNHQNALADGILTKRYGNVYVDQQQILQAYFATKMYDRLEKIYANRVAKDPTDIQSAVAEAVLQYFVTGNKSVGIAALNKLIAANPSVKTQIQSFIDQINAGTLKP
jgi:O-antigen ligase/thioredoxin-like negative regulator of GroEL